MIFIIAILLVIIYYLKHMLEKECKKILVFIILILIELVYCVYWFAPISFPIQNYQQINDQQISFDVIRYTSKIKTIEISEQQKKELFNMLLELKLNRCYKFQVPINFQSGKYFYLSFYHYYPEHGTDIVLNINPSNSFAEIIPDNFIFNLISKITNFSYVYTDYYKIRNSEKIMEFLNNLQ